MGCGASKIDPELREAAAVNEKIEKQLRQDNRTDQKTVKILLLGKYPLRSTSFHLTGP